jgi:hypothetical protein
LPHAEEIPATGGGAARRGAEADRAVPARPQWSVERRNFAALTIKAALAWRDTLAQLGAEVLASEEWLKGEWSGIAVHGQTDLILGLPGGSAAGGGLQALELAQATDADAEGVRQPGEPVSGDDREWRTERSRRKAALAARLRGAQQTGVVYYLLNDQVALSDTALAGAAAVPGWRTSRATLPARR